MSDEKIAWIRARHEHDEMMTAALRVPELHWTSPVVGWRAHNDRATLLAEVERLQGLLRGLSRDVVEGIERLTREHDEARYFLAIFVHAHASNNAVPPRIEEQARKALEAKP